MPDRQFSTESEKRRLEMFIDAILAILITILVLEFKVPEEPFSSDAELTTFIHHLFPSFFSYGISFAIIITLWIDHHLLFHLIEKADIRFALLNFVLILFLSPVPFTTALAGRNHESSGAVALVATNYFLIVLSAFFLGWYAFAKKMIPEDRMKERFFKRDIKVAIIGILLLAISIPLAFVDTYISFTLFITVIGIHLSKQFFH